MAQNAVGQVQVLVIPDGSQFGAQLQAILDQAAGKAAQAGRAIGQNVSQQVVPQMQAVNRSVMDAGMQFDMAARKALAFTGAVMGTKAIIEGMVGKLAGVFDQLAQAQAGFSAILGERKGEALLDEVRQFAKDTPFATRQLVNYSQQLLGVGMASEKIVPLLRDTGNVIASVGGDTANISRVLYAMSQIQTVGRLMGQDAMQLQSSLIPITKLLASYLGKTTTEVKKLQEQGRISAEQVFAAIQQAGQKVPNAMANAVKTIAGAREVLRDSIQILLQDAPALRNVYDDIVKAIQTMAAALSSEEVSGAISRAMEEFGQFYEAFKPIIASFAEAAGSGAMTYLKFIGETFSFLADVLNAIPDPMLDLIAKFFAAIATIKAPLMLIKYVQQFQTMANIFKGDLLLGMSNVTSQLEDAQNPTDKLTKANYALAASYDAVNRSASGASSGISGATSTLDGGGAPVPPTPPAGGRFARARALASRPMVRVGIAAAGMVAGQAISNAGEDNMAANVLGGAMQGASIGAVAGPWGAAAGLAIGGMMSFFSAQKKAAEKHKQEMADIGKETAEGYLEELDSRFGDALTGEKMTEISNKIQEIRTSLNNELSNAVAVGQQEYVDRTWESIASDAQLAYDRGDEGAVPLTEQQARDIAAQRFAGTTTSPSGRVIQGRGAQGVSAVINIPENISDLTSDAALQQREELAAYTEQYNNTLDDIRGKLYPAIESLGPEVQKKLEGSLTAMGRRGTRIPLVSSIEEAEDVMKRYGLTLEEVLSASSEEISAIIDAFEGLASAEQEELKIANARALSSQKSALEADALFGNRIKALQSEAKAISTVASAMDAVTKAYENQSDRAAQLAAEQAKLAAAQAVYENTRDRVFAENSGKMLDSEAEALAKQRAEIEYRKTLDRFTVKAIESQQELEKQYGLTNDQLLTLLGLEKDIVKNQKIVVTADVEQALKAYAALLTAKAALEGKIKLEGMIFENREKYFALEDALAAIRKQFEDVPAATTGGSKGGGGQSFADKVKSAGDMLKSTIESAMESVKSAAEAWKATIKDRVQYEQAVGVGRALRNVQRQSTDIRALTTGIAQLKARGLSEEALTALDINALTDVRQVKRLMSASPEELRRLSTAVAQRDKLASTLASDRQQEENRKTITKAILEAARILGYKFTEAQAKAISAEFNITTETDAKKMMEEILRLLSGGKITSVPTT
jgi:tape measure domain-containing protein